MSSQFIKHHADGLKTVTSSSVQGGARRANKLTEEQQKIKSENHSFWMDRKHEREKWS